VAVLLPPMVGGLLAGVAWWEERLFRLLTRHVRPAPAVIRGWPTESVVLQRMNHTGAQRRHAAR
jgi:hypothetical protein